MVLDRRFACRACRPRHQHVGLSYGSGVRWLRDTDELWLLFSVCELFVSREMSCVVMLEKQVNVFILLCVAFHADTVPTRRWQLIVPPSCVHIPCLSTRMPL